MRFVFVSFIFAFFYIFSDISLAQSDYISSLDEVVGLAIEYSDTVRKIDAQKQLSSISTERALAAYDAILKASVSFTREDLDTNLPLSGGVVNSQEYNLLFSKPFKTGTSLALSLSHIRSPVEMYGITPNRISSVSLSISQDLLKNAFGLILQANIDMASFQSQIQSLLADDALEAFVFEVESAFWDWQYLNKAEKCYSEILKQTEWLDGIYREKLKLGTAERPDVLAVSASVLTRRSALVDVQLKLEQGLYFLQYLCSSKLQLTSVDFEAKTLDKDLKFYISRALSGRRDDKVLSLSLQQVALKMKTDENSLLPSLKLSATASFNSADDDVGSSFSNMFNGGSELKIGLNFSMPFGKDKEYTNIREDMLTMQKISSDLSRLEAKIRQEVKDAYELCVSLYKRYRLVKQARQLQEERLDAEKQRLLQGRSSADLFLRAQLDLLNAKMSEIFLKTTFKKAKARLFRVCAMTLDKYKIAK